MEGSAGEMKKKRMAMPLFFYCRLLRFCFMSVIKTTRNALARPLEKSSIVLKNPGRYMMLWRPCCCNFIIH